MQERTVVVTGANSGIGFAAAREIAGTGARVVMVCRNAAKAERARTEIATATGNERITVELCDLAERDSVRDLLNRFRRSYDRLDVLVNNAGITASRRSVTGDGIETVFAVNHLGYFHVTVGLFDLLRNSAPARIVNVASDAHRGAHIDFDDLNLERGYSAWEVYRRSKLANLLFTFELARRIEGTGVTVNAMHPGVVRTNIWRNASDLGQPLLAVGKLFMRSAEKGADTVVWLATAEEVHGVTGRYFVDRKETEPSSAALDASAAARLWEVSERLTGVRLP